MERHDEPKEADYPRGRGYGHDYMRGGEVFGGYGYQDRADYQRPRGSQESELAAVVPAADALATAVESPAVEVPSPRDLHADDREIPHEPVEGTGIASTTGERRASANGAIPGADAPVPEIEHTFGDSGGNRLHSRSYYVTQAQLQQRLFRRTDTAP